MPDRRDLLKMMGAAILLPLLPQTVEAATEQVVIPSTGQSVPLLDNTKLAAPGRSRLPSPVKLLGLSGLILETSAGPFPLLRQDFTSHPIEFAAGDELHIGWTVRATGVKKNRKAMMDLQEDRGGDWQVRYGADRGSGAFGDTYTRNSNTVYIGPGTGTVWLGTH